MHRTTTPLALLACATAAHAQPSAFEPDLLVATIVNGSQILDIAAPFPLLDLAPGASIVIDPFSTAFASPIRVSYDVETAGNERTVSLRYETVDGAPFVTQALVDTLTFTPTADFALFFAVGFSDDEWLGGSVTRERRLLGDGVDLFTPGPVTLNPQELSPPLLGLVDENSPAGPGFGRPTSLTGGAIADTFLYELTYTVVPAPASIVAFIAPCALLARRRR